MADQLGEAVLKIRVDDGDALRKLGELKSEISEFETRTTRSRRAAATPVKPKSGLTEFLRELRTREQAETAADRRIARRREEAAARLRSESVRGSVRAIGSPRFTARGARQGGPREDIRALEIAQERRFRIARRIDLLEENGVNVARLRNRLGALTEAQSFRQFGTFRQISQELRRQITLEERRLATRRRQQGEATRGARQGGPSESITARFDAQRSRYRLDQQIRSLEAAGVNTDQLRVRLGEITEAQARRRFGTAKQLGQQLGFQLQKERDILSTRQRQERIQTRQTRAADAEARRIGRLNAVPVRGNAAIPGSPAFLDAQFPAFPTDFFRNQRRTQAEQRRRAAERASRRSNILSNALIGGAFPALFGQGLGASLGGAAGGAAGGAIGGQFGFGLSLVGTALGAQFDAALNKAKELAKALDNPIAQFSAIKENALLSSKGLEKNVEALIATGREAEAAALIQEDLAKTFGNAQEVQNFVNETDKLNRAWTETSVTLAAFVAGPLAGLLGRLNEPIQGFNAAGRVARATAGLSPDQRAQVEQFTRRRQRELGVPGIAATDAQSLQLNLDILAEIERIQGRNNNALERAARNQKILTQSATTLVKLEDAIGRARIGGNKPLEDSITLSRELLTNYRERKNIEQQLAAKQIKAAQATELTGQSLAKDRTLRQDYLDSSRESLINATKELETTKQLSGLEGTRLEVAQRRIELSKAFNLRELRGQQLTDARTNASLNPGNENFRILFQGALQSFVTAGVDFETKLRQASDYLKQAAKDAATNLTNALLNVGKLEADPGGLNRFLTRDEQFESNRRAILRLGGDGSKGPSQLESAITKATELLGLTRNQANERFQGLRDIISGARQGRFASQEGFNTLSGFIQDTLTREQAVTGVGDAQKTLADITSLNVTVQKELSTAVKENTVALNAVFGKDWSVNLAVQGGEVAAYGDVISRNLTP